MSSYKFFYFFAIRYGSVEVEKATKMFGIFTTNFTEFFCNLIFRQSSNPTCESTVMAVDKLL